jgi:hypothetical protein
VNESPTANLAQAIVPLLDRQQFGPGDRFLIFLPVPCGLGGQISGRVLSLAMALGLGRKAVFLDPADPPYTQTFAPLHGPVELGSDPYQAPLADLAADQPDRVVCYDPSRMAAFGPQFDRTLIGLVASRTGLDIPDRLHLDGAIFTWMKPTAAVEAFCEAERERLGVGPDTLGVHFRRGDKAVETAFVPAAEINRQIAEVHRAWPFSSLFLASDSPQAPQEVICPQGVKLIFDAGEQRFNNANHKMLLENPDLAEVETRVAFKNIALLARCGGIVGQDNAHFATLASGAILARETRPERIALIDGRHAEKRSSVLTAWFRIKLALRALARKLLPFMTAQARLARARSESRITPSPPQ